MSTAAASTQPSAQHSASGAARPQTRRLVSLDAFRGATIAGMILVNNLGDHSNAYPPLTHASWNGWTMTDLVFPFFLWIMGVAMAYSAASRHARGEKPEVFLRHVFTRAGALFAIGLFLNAFPAFDFPQLRILGVLQRIALCYLFASIIQFYSGTRGLIAWAVGLLTTYWLLMTLYPVPGFGPGVLEQQGNFAQYIDSLVLKGHLYKNQLLWDPEGLVSTLTSIANTLFGILCGGILRSHEDEDSTKLRSMLVYGTALVAIGLLCDRWLPINKNLWTSSYSMFTSGLAFLGMAASWWIVDVHGFKRPAWFFLVFGVNAITVYTASSILSDVMSITGWKKALYDGVFLQIASPINASALYGLANVAVLFVFAYVLYRKQIFVKL